MPIEITAVVLHSRLITLARQRALWSLKQAMVEMHLVPLSRAGIHMHYSASLIVQCELR